MKLNLASGQMYLEGYINIDNASMYGGNMSVDKQADIFTLEWENNTVDEILLSHFAGCRGCRRCSKHHPSSWC